MEIKTELYVKALKTLAKLNRISENTKFGVIAKGEGDIPKWLKDGCKIADKNGWKYCDIA